MVNSLQQKKDDYAKRTIDKIKEIYLAAVNKKQAEAQKKEENQIHPSNEHAAPYVENKEVFVVEKSEFTRQAVNMSKEQL